MNSRLFVRLLACLTALGMALGQEGAERKSPFEGLTFRSVGPVNMSGRVADVEGVAGDPRVVYVGSASGGVWKTEDGGVTFRPVFDDMPVASIGDVAVAPSNPEVVYVGTGESNTRNSVSFGNGVYKSTDGGKGWTHLGLDDTRHISRIAVHPRNPDVVYVGAVGHIFGPNEQRGVFRSKDGGKSWEKVLYLDEQHGVADLDLDPHNPNLVYAALWLFQRRPWTFESGSEQGGVWRSTDGGDSWKKLQEGLPKLMGRIAVKVAPSNPKTVYVMAESNEGTLFRSDDQGETFRKVSEEPEIVSRGFYYTDLRVDPQDENTVYAVSSRLQKSIDGGQTFQRISRATHIDFHSLWIDPLNPQRMWQGQDGGVAVSYDGGQNWEPVRNLPLAQFYQVYADDRQPFYYLGGGLQDNGTWYGPSRTREPAGILADDWRMLSFGDAFFVVPHPDDPEVFLSESQAGNIFKTDMKTRQQVDISPQPRRNDGGPVGDLEYRFHWNSPIIQSPHDPYTVYFAGNVVFRSRDFGESWQRISPDLTTDDPDKQGQAGGPVWFENTTAEYHCTLISFAESPARAGQLWAGSDDGRLHASQDEGRNWSDLTAGLGAPEFSPISHIEPSRTSSDLVYVALDRHMFDDPAPYILRSQDGGQSWTRIVQGLPENAYVWVVREDPRNPDLIYAGTEVGLYASYDRGGSWQRMQLANLPAVAVHDLILQPSQNDLILGTHGRALWILDDATPLQDWPQVDAQQPAHLFAVRKALRFPSFFTRYGLGDKVYKAPNPPYGALITYNLASRLSNGADKDKEGGKGELKLEILDAGGSVIRTLKDPPAEKGLNRTAWDLRVDPPLARTDEGGPADEFFGPGGGPQVLPGRYTVRLSLGGQSWQTPVEVGIDPLLSVDSGALEAQFEAGSKLAAMLSTANRCLRGLDLLSAQLQERRQTARKSGIEWQGELKERWEAFGKEHQEALDTLTRPEGKPFWSEGPRLTDRLQDLLRSLSGGFRAPTEPQMQLIEDLEGELREAVEKTNRVLEQADGPLSKALSTADLPPLKVPAPVER